MAGKARVHELAKELNITSKDVLAMLTEIGEFVQSASSVVEAPVADKLRQRCGKARPPTPPRSTPGGRSRSARDYRRNDPYQDLGKTEIDHLQAADRPVRHYDDHRPNPFGVAPRPRTVASPRPSRDVVAPPPLVPTRPQRRAWYRGDEPSGLTKYLLDHKIVKMRSDKVKPPNPPWRYFVDEVKRAQAIGTRWAHTMLTGLDYSDIYHWIDVLGEEPWNMSGFPNHDPSALAAQLHQAGVEPYELNRWTYDDAHFGTLDVRLLTGQLTVEQVIVEVERRRSAA